MQRVQNLHFLNYTGDRGTPAIGAQRIYLFIIYLFIIYLSINTSKYKQVVLEKYGSVLPKYIRIFPAISGNAERAIGSPGDESATQKMQP